MKTKLKKLFDYQAFAGNARIEKLAKDADTHVGAALSDDDLAGVNAAGQIENIRAQSEQKNFADTSKTDAQ